MSFLHDGVVAGVAFSPAAPQLATACGQELALWSPESHMVFKDQVRGTASQAPGAALVI